MVVVPSGEDSAEGGTRTKDSVRLSRHFPLGHASSRAPGKGHCNRYHREATQPLLSLTRHGGEQRAQAKEPSAKHRAAVAYLQQARPWRSSPSPLDLRLWFPSSAAFWDRRRRVLCDARALRRHRRLQPLRAHLPLPRDRVHHGLRPHLPTEHRLSAVLGGASSTHHSPLTTHRSALAEP